MAGEPRHREADGGSSVALRQAALDAAILHLVGESRSWLLQVEHYLNDLGSLGDERTARVVEALGLTLAEPARPGTLRHVKQAATHLLRSLTTTSWASRTSVARPGAEASRSGEPRAQSGCGPS